MADLFFLSALKSSEAWSSGMTPFGVDVGALEAASRGDAGSGGVLDRVDVLERCQEKRRFLPMAGGWPLTDSCASLFMGSWLDTVCLSWLVPFPSTLAAFPLPLALPFPLVLALPFPLVAGCLEEGGGVACCGGADTTWCTGVMDAWVFVRLNMFDIVRLKLLGLLLLVDRRDRGGDES